MLFKVTHIDAAGHRHQSRVTARNLGDAMDQVVQAWGDPQRLACVRMRVNPVLHLVPAKTKTRRALCGY